MMLRGTGMTTDASERSDFVDYHKSLTAELEAVKNRVRNLIRHWATDGAFKEAALRNVLRRHLPESMTVGTGFIVSKDGEFSSQIDLLIVQRQFPTLFKDGDLLIVSPNCVHAIIEVKTNLSGSAGFQEALAKVATCKKLCREWPASHEVFTGLFVYEGTESQSKNMIREVKKRADEDRVWIKSISYGSDVIGMNHPGWRLPNGVDLGNSWVVLKTPGLAPAYFISSLLHCLFHYGSLFALETWFPNQAANEYLHHTDPTTAEVCSYVRSA